ncbi:hypothetical protein BH09PSE6_BH09PSE6_21170 [soil metagenome]
MYEVHLFQAVATATDAVEGDLRRGSRHGILVFSRQASGTPHDWTEAEAGLTAAGWEEVSFERAGTLDPENMNGKDMQMSDAFTYAMLGGCGLIVYRDPLPS